MSDWKSRATPVATEDWKARAKQNSADRAPFEGIPAEPIIPEADFGEPRSLSGTAIRSFARDGSFNFSDEIGGALGVADELGRRQRAFLGATGPDSVPVESAELSLKDALVARYRRERDDSRSEVATGAATNPKTSFLSGIAGSLASPVPFGKSKALTAVGKGAAVGSLSGLGSSESDLTEGEVGGALVDTGLAGGGGALIGGAFTALGPKAGVRMGQRAEMNALKGLGVRAGISEQLAKRGYETAAEGRTLGRVALDDGITPWLGTAESVAENAAEAQVYRGAMIENALNKSKATGINPDFDSISMRAALNASEGDMLPTSLWDSRPARRIVKNIGALEGRDILDANKAKSQIYDGINWKADTNLSTKMQRQAVRGLREGIEEHVENTAGPQFADELRTANQRYGQLADIKSLASEEALRLMGRKNGTIAGALGTAAMGASLGTAGVGLGVAKYGLEKAAPFIDNFTARTQNALAPRMAGAFQRVGTAAQNTARQAQEALRRPKDQQDEDAVSALLNGAW